MNNILHICCTYAIYAAVPDYVRERRIQWSLGIAQPNSSSLQTRDMKLIANLSNRRHYEYTDEQAKKIVKALQRALDSVKQSFADAEIENSPEFKL